MNSLLNWGNQNVYMSTVLSFLQIIRICDCWWDKFKRGKSGPEHGSNFVKDWGHPTLAQGNTVKIQNHIKTCYIWMKVISSSSYHWLHQYFTLNCSLSEHNKQFSICYKYITGCESFGLSRVRFHHKLFIFLQLFRCNLSRSQININEWHLVLWYFLNHNTNLLFIKIASFVIHSV